MKRLLRLKISSIVLSSALLIVASPVALGQLAGNCGSLKNGYGPFDYTNPTHVRTKLQVVETYHFDARAEGLKGHAGNIARLAGDLDYTLRAFPNHHKALYAMLRYSLSKDPAHRNPLPLRPDCYFQRAMAWSPSDGKVPLLYGIYKARTGEMEGARQLFATAESLTPESAELLYNIGLVLAKNKQFDEALPYAHKAYALGYPLPGLRSILTRNGKWSDSTQ